MIPLGPYMAGGGAVVMLLAMLGVATYLVPAWIALGRGKHNAPAILALDLLLGWTIIGWVVALIWALAYEPPDPRRDHLIED